MKVFLDTNILLETVFDRQYKFACDQILLHGQGGNIDLYASFLTFANMAYILQRHKVPREQIYQIERMLDSQIEVLPMDRNQLRTALRHEVKDFEDMLQYQSALAGGCDCIVTINTDDFAEFSSLPIYSPDELLDRLDSMD
jgi:predicted nucleic acid-binding protein